jgi:hypothetical protein
MTFSGVKKVNYAEMAIVPFNPLASRERGVSGGNEIGRLRGGPSFVRLDYRVLVQIPGCASHHFLAWSGA